MKYFIASLIVIVLFILPLGSYYYLNSGYNFRKAALVELESEGPLFSSVDSEFLRTMKDSLMGGNTNLIYLEVQKDPAHGNELQMINDKYDHRFDFQVVNLSKNEVPELFRSYQATPLILVDSLAQIRDTYSFNSEDIKRLIRHISILLPMDKRPDIHLKRDLK